MMEMRVGKGVTIQKNQFGFMLGYSTTKVIYLKEDNCGNIQKTKRELYMMFVDLEKVNYKV